MDKVTKFRGITTVDIPADTVLESAVGKLTGVVVVGWDEDGELYFASSYGARGETLWLLEKAKLELLSLAMS
jgi:hypothetical protein